MYIFFWLKEYYYKRVKNCGLSFIQMENCIDFSQVER